MKSKKHRKNIDRNQLIIKGFLQNLLVSFPALLGAGLFLTPWGPHTRFRLALSGFIAGFTGVIQIIRKESPTAIVTIKGKPAIIEGVIFTAICWGLSAVIWFGG